MIFSFFLVSIGLTYPSNSFMSTITLRRSLWHSVSNLRLYLRPLVHNYTPSVSTIKQLLVSWYTATCRVSQSIMDTRNCLFMSDHCLFTGRTFLTNYLLYVIVVLSPQHNDAISFCSNSVVCSLDHCVVFIIGAYRDLTLWYDCVCVAYQDERHSVGLMSQILDCSIANCCACN